MLYTNKLKSEVEKMAKYCTNDMVCPECGMQQGGYASPQEMQSIDGMRPQESNGKSVASLVLGIVGVIAWCLPILGLPVGVIGLIMGIQGYNRSNAKGMAMAGIVLSIICLVLTIINSSIGAYMGSQGMLFN